MRAFDPQSVAGIALRARRHIVEMSTGPGTFAGAALSCVDLLAYLYGTWLDLDPAHPEAPERDHLLLSKGHAVAALYGVLAETGFVDPADLGPLPSADGRLYLHPSRTVPGVEFHSGSLGHLPAVGVGMALDARLRGRPNRIVVIVGDGELDEGSVWEALLVASARALGNYVMVVDRNRLQANLATEELVPLEPLTDKLAAFGAEVVEVDGHDLDDLDRAFRPLDGAGDRPVAVIAHTVRGKGIPEWEGREEHWYVALDRPGADDALRALAADRGRT